MSFPGPEDGDNQSNQYGNLQSYHPGSGEQNPTGALMGSNDYAGNGHVNLGAMPHSFNNMNLQGFPYPGQIGTLAGGYPIPQSHESLHGAGNANQFVTNPTFSGNVNYGLMDGNMGYNINGMTNYGMVNDINNGMGFNQPAMNTNIDGAVFANLMMNMNQFPDFSSGLTGLPGGSHFVGEVVSFNASNDSSDVANASGNSSTNVPATCPETPAVDASGHAIEGSETAHSSNTLDNSPSPPNSPEPGSTITFNLASTPRKTTTEKENEAQRDMDAAIKAAGIPTMDALLNPQLHNLDMKTTFASLEDAVRANMRQALPFKPLRDPTMPQTAEQKRAIVNALCSAIKFTEKARDNEKMIAKFMVPRNWTDDEIEHASWRLLESCIRRHERGQLLAPYGTKKTNIEFPSFADRMNEMIRILCTYKTLCEHLFATIWIYEFIDDPITCRKRVDNNKYLNARKSLHIDAGRKALSLATTETPATKRASTSKRASAKKSTRNRKRTVIRNSVEDVFVDSPGQNALLSGAKVVTPSPGNIQTPPGADLQTPSGDDSQTTPGSNFQTPRSVHFQTPDPASMLTGASEAPTRMTDSDFEGVAEHEWPRGGGLNNPLGPPTMRMPAFGSNPNLMGPSRTWAAPTSHPRSFFLPGPVNGVQGAAYSNMTPGRQVYQTPMTPTPSNRRKRSISELEQEEAQQASGKMSKH